MIGSIASRKRIWEFVTLISERLKTMREAKSMAIEPDGPEGSYRITIHMREMTQEESDEAHPEAARRRGDS